MIDVEITDYGMNGEGVAKLDGKIILLDKVLKGETVQAEIKEDKGNYAIAKTKNIITKSKNRTTPPCPYYNQCGGCDLQHMNYAEQLKFKQQLIQKTLKKICKIDTSVNETINCDLQYNYRNKLSINAQNKQFGFYQANSKNLVEINCCLLASESINAAYNVCKDFILNKNLQAKNIVIRVIENQMLIGIVSKTELDLNELYSILKLKFDNFGLYNIVNTRNDSVVLSGKTKHVGGLANITINAFGLTYSVDLIGFHQTNINIQNKLYYNVLNLIEKNKFVVNGFSGQGLLSAILAKQAKHVVGIELNASAHMSAEQLKHTNNIKNLTNIKGDFNKLISNYISKADTLILDPAKKGCGKETMQKIIGVKELIYISCNPIALAKDLNVIKDHYVIESITPFDMFPNTKNVETLVKLKYKKGE